MLKRIRWDPAKADENRRKHGVAFEEAQTIFLDPLMVSVDDRPHSDNEDRYFAIEQSTAYRLLAVSYTIRRGEAWLINARVPEPAERRRYMKGKELRDRGPEPENDPTGHLDWEHARRGPLIEARGPLTVVIEPVVAEFFRSEAAVNNALRQMINEGRVGMWSRD